MGWEIPRLWLGMTRRVGLMVLNCNEVGTKCGREATRIGWTAEAAGLFLMVDYAILAVI
jgi:hypothetical protein